ncbi:MAG: DUF58 domain-containing protein [Defluviitaleaceae bacterium]|nr:DUF58 domain-containing protein [Defluviitaleaceae bacterium]
MAKNRIVYIIWLLAVGVLHIFGNQYSTRVILYASIFIPAMMIFLTWNTSRRMDFRLNLPKTRQQGEKIDTSIHIKAGWLAGHTKYQLLCENLFTGESWQETSAEREFYIHPKHCGILRVTVSHSRVFDIFGLFGWKIKSQPQDSVLMMPKQAPTPFEISPETTLTLDSEEYSMTHPGNDPSETFAIREYAPGDPLKSIHWKLSNKTDKLLVRELGLPVTQNILVLVETSIPEETSPDHISKMAGVAYNMCHQLIESETPQTLGWLDTTSLEYKSQEITNITELDEAFAELLANTAKACTTTATKSCDKHGYSQILVVRAGDEFI